MNGIFGAIIGAAGFGAANVVIKKSLLNLSIPQTLMMSSVSGVFFLLIFALVNNALVSITWTTILLATLLACGEVVLYLVLYKTFEVSNVTVATAVSGTYPILSTIVTILLFSEVLALNKIIFILLLVLGAIITSINWADVFKDGFDKKDVVKGFGWIGATTLLHAFYFPMLGKFTATGSWESKLLLIKVVSTLLIYIIFRLIKKQSVLPPKELIPFTSLLGLLEVVSWAGFSWATSSTEGQTAVLIAALNSAALVTAILAYFFLDEKLSRFQYLGILLIVASLTGLSL